jgi:hypothetical protein
LDLKVQCQEHESVAQVAEIRIDVFPPEKRYCCDLCGMAVIVRVPKADDPAAIEEHG